jgi:DNA repair protein RadD
MTELRDYQLDGIARIIAAVEAGKNPCVVAPTGSGKTIVGGGLIVQLIDKHVLWLAHRRELIFQPRNKLRGFDIDAGVILSGEKMQQMARVQCASVQTYSARYVRGNMNLPPADIIIVDECHHVRAKTYQKIIEQYPDAIIIGLTATPCRGDKRGLGNVFDVLIELPQVDELIKSGHLVGTKVYAPSTPDLVGVHVRQGDYVLSELEQRVDKPKLVGEIVTHVLRHARGLKVLIFATSVAHSRHIEEELRRAGGRVAHVDGSTPKEERDGIVAQLTAGEIEVITNCAVFTEGFDLPEIGCIVLARPTKSFGLFRQMIGRGLRPAPGKDKCLILDHAGATFQHGFAEDPVAWTLEEDRKAVNSKHDERVEAVGYAERGILTCKQCDAVRTAGKACPECGFLPKRPAEYLSVIDGDLEQLNHNGTRAPSSYSLQERKAWYLGLLHMARERGHRDGAAAHRYKEKFREWPPRHWANCETCPPSDEVRAWDRHLRIKYAKSMERRAANG